MKGMNQLYEIGEMQKKKLRLTILLISFVTFVSSFACFIISNNNKKTESTEVYATWSESFDTLDEMAKSSDIIVKGKVCDSIPEQRADLIFTMQYIQITEVVKGSININEEVQVLQTGGTIGNIYTEAFSDCPLLTKGEDYILYLKQSEVSEEYGQYYLISGGYQGVAEVEGNNLEVISNSNEILNDYEKEEALVEDTYDCIVKEGKHE